MAAFRQDREQGSASLLAPLLTIFETARISVPTLADALLGRASRQACSSRLDAWSARLVRHAGAEIEVFGEENYLSTEETFVVISNHQSLFDVPVTFAVFRRPLRMVAKTELYRIPIFGPALTSAEFIEIDRTNKERAWASIALAEEKLRSGISVWIAPEGTRSRDGRLGKFKRGGFVLALQTHSRILPMTIDGAREVLPTDKFLMHKGKKVRVTFHPPVDPAPYGVERIEELMALVAGQIGSALPHADGAGPEKQGAP